MPWLRGHFPKCLSRGDMVGVMYYDGISLYWNVLGKAEPAEQARTISAAKKLNTPNRCFM
jgi:hypothetical protein